ncbi:hypothetical protein SADUNF_Sadunf14G0018000 [Salix dunnii]|uniref:EF-hand domain-containing protein n=1 Tax=Salix dunnii TaxID=1413687 RepID=A0A835JK51_9ROSI|nr:hypothetical protein SADUNF_Sadunf14G0018000 [Salix dunnii]
MRSLHIKNLYSPKATSIIQQYLSLILKLMAIKYRNITVDGEHAITMEQFKAWMKTIDDDKDGKISKDELADAVRGNGGWFAGWKAKRGVGSADSNGNGFVDESEIRNLAEFAQKYLELSLRYCSLELPLVRSTAIITVSKRLHGSPHRVQGRSGIA